MDSSMPFVVVKISRNIKVTGHTLTMGCETFKFNLRLANIHSAAGYSDRLLAMRLSRSGIQVVSVRINSGHVRYCTSCWTRTLDPLPRCQRRRGSCGRGPWRHFTHIKCFLYVHLASNMICHDHGSIHRYRFSG